MARKVDKTPKLCVICNDRAKGVNFNAQTCMSCKAFFRRNALRNKEMKCPFNDNCVVDKITRKFCSKCRLKKCFAMNMKKEWILSDEEKRLIKEKIMRNRLRRQQQELEAQQQTSSTSPNSASSASTLSSSTGSGGGKGKRSVEGKHQSPISVAHKTGAAAANPAAGGRRRLTASKANFLPSGKAAAYRNRSSGNGGGFESSNSSSSATTTATSGNNSHLYSTLNTSVFSAGGATQVPQTSDAASEFGSSASTKFSGTAAALNAFNIFQEPSAYSLDILLSDNCDAFFDPTLGGGGSNTGNQYIISQQHQQQNTVLHDEWLYSSTGNTSSTAGTLSQSEAKKDDFVQSLAGAVSEIDESLNTALNDCLLFVGDTSSMDLFENDNDLDGLEAFSGSSSGISECNESSNHESPMYDSSQTAVLVSNSSTSAGHPVGSIVTDIADIKNELQELGNSNAGGGGGGGTGSHIITSVTTGSNSTFEYSAVKTETHDFTQYLLHDNDPTFNLAATGSTANNTSNSGSNNQNNNNNNTLEGITHGGHSGSQQQQSNKVTAAHFPSLNNNLTAVQSINHNHNNPNLNNHNNSNQQQSMALVQKSYNFSAQPNSWESGGNQNNALQVANVRYMAADGGVYAGNRSKVPPLVKMAPPPSLPHPPLTALPPPNPEANDFISNCLISNNDHSDEACNYDPVIEDVPRIGTNEVMLREIGFSNRELILPERCLIKELTEACSVLKNPYKRILVFNNYDSVRSCRITEYSFHRLIRCAKRLSRFSMLPLGDQAKMLKYSLLEMLAMRSVLSYNPDRESWGFIDDKCKVNVMVRMDVIRPFSTKCGFQRHKNFPNLFRHEWKSDDIIFNLLTAIVLFTPRPGLCEYEKTKEEHLRYVYLLRRYLEIKYPTIAEAKESFSQLMNHIEEMRQLNADIMFFFRSYAQLLQTSPLFTQLLDLGNGQSAKPSPHQNTDPFGVPVFDDPSMYSLPEVNQQQQQMDGNNMTRTASVSSAASSSTTSSSAPQQHQYAPAQSSYGHNGSQMDNNNSAGVPLMNTTTTTYSVDNSANQQASSTTSSTSSASTASSNAYRECIINSAH